MSNLDVLLKQEVLWLVTLTRRLKSTTTSVNRVDVNLLEGRLSVIRELLGFMDTPIKYQIGGDPRLDVCLIREILDCFIFPFSKVYSALAAQQENIDTTMAWLNPVCSTSSCINAAYDVLVALCTGCPKNLEILSDLLTKMFSTPFGDEPPLSSMKDWDYMPTVGPRPPGGFVGLKNAGATCYMNSVLQQLYMIRQVREGLLRVTGTTPDAEEDFSGEGCANEDTSGFVNSIFNSSPTNTSVTSNSSDKSRKEYHIVILKQIQAIFGHLAASTLQFYIPKGLWQHFKIQDEFVNLREQHDACEFYNILVENINEALKALGEPQLLNTYLGGSFADMKICKTCPHRYTREEAYTVISIDIRNYSNLQESLEQYVKGDLLEGDNAYFCEKCDKKVDTVKRICLKKLPPVLAIQLKRFDYDWERETSIKFNDYFAFPRDLDLEPYTVRGLAKQNEQIAYEEEDMNDRSCSKYKLTGIVVHSGQASGGHYYSFIKHRDSVNNTDTSQWYRFDDDEVSECRMHDDDEMKGQCFGGEYLSDQQIYDHTQKRLMYRKQKRWWNAYLLFYTREDVESEQLSQTLSETNIAEHPQLLKMPTPIEKSVLRQNVKFLHKRSQFTLEYFMFMRKMLSSNCEYVQGIIQQNGEPEIFEEISLLTMKLVMQFLFSVGLRSKKSLRGPLSEWLDSIGGHLRYSARSRQLLVRQLISCNSALITDYIVDSPVGEVGCDESSISLFEPIF